MYRDIKFSKEELYIMLNCLYDYMDEYEDDLRTWGYYSTLGEICGRIEDFLREK